MRYRGFPQIRDMHGDPVLASKLGFAKTLVGIAQGIQSRSGKQHVRLRREVDGVSIEVLVFGDQSAISITHVPANEERVQFGFARLVWMPEGFLIYPKSPEYPKGWGLPVVDGELVAPTADGGPTPGGALPLVLVNRLKNNNYPDQFAPSHFPVPFFYMPWEGEKSAEGVKSIGVQGPPVNGVWPKFKPQFSRRWEQILREPYDTAWHAHWAEVVNLDPVRQGILDKTNEVRSGMPPLLPPLRGVYHGAGALIVRQMGMTGVQAHNYEGYRPGHTTMDERAIDRSAFWFTVNASENLLTTRPVEGETAYEAGRRMGEMWESSPTHKANMLREYHAETSEDSRGIPAVGFLHIGLGRGTTHTGRPPEGGEIKYEPPVQGWQASQVMYGMTRQVLARRAYWRGAAGTVSWSGASSCKYAAAATIYGSSEVDAAEWAGWVYPLSVLAISGRMKPVYAVGVEAYTARGVVSAALHISEDGEVRLRVCTITKKFLLELWDGLAHASWKEFSVLASFDLTAGADGAGGTHLLRAPIFSPDGAKCLVTIDRVLARTAPAIRQQQWDFSAPPEGEVVVCGSVRDFLEFTGAGFTHIHRSAVDITPETMRTEEIVPATLLDPPVVRNEYVETCAETFRWLGDYDADNALVWASVRVDIRVDQWREYSPGYWINPGSGPQQNNVDFEQVVEFPDGSELTTAQWTLREWRAAGFFLALHTLDILRPENTAYSKLLLRNVDEGEHPDMPSAGVELWWRGEKLKEKDEVTWGVDGVKIPAARWRYGCRWAGGIMAPIVANAYMGGGWYFYYPYGNPWGVTLGDTAATYPAQDPFPAQAGGDRARAPYPAVMTSTLWSTVHQGFTHACTQTSYQIAPALVGADSYREEVDLNMWEYDGEMILSGTYINPLHDFAERGFWEPEEDRTLWRATFDLAAAVGKPLGNDIEPVGVV